VSEPSSPRVGKGACDVGRTRELDAAVNTAHRCPVKTTLDIPESLLRRVKTRAAISGTTMTEFFVEAAEEKLSSEASQREKTPGWRAAFGRLPRGSTAAVDQALAGEFEGIDPGAWM
jgi:hypothetical protein